jgi:colicin import membrane protein
MKKLQQQKDQAKRQEMARQRQLAQEAERAKQAKLAEMKRVEDLKKQADALKVEQEKMKKLAAENLKKLQQQKAEQEKQLAEIKKKQVEEAKRMEQQLAKQKEAELLKQQKVKAEAQAKAQSQAAEAKRAQEFADRQRMAGEVDRYKALILNAIRDRWILPENVDPGLSSQFVIRLAPTGTVMDVRLAKSSGDALLDRTAQAAIWNASPLPVPSDATTFNMFREITLTVRPSNARG